MKRQQRIEALEYFNKHNLIVFDYHHTKRHNELDFESEQNIITRSMFAYLLSIKLISYYGFAPFSNERHKYYFMINKKGEQKLRQLKGKHEYFNQKKK